jgi:aldehyde dehydrogenase (NAD+)
MGGHRQSGLGRENGVEGLLEYTNTQSLSVRKGRASAPPSAAVRAAAR